MQRHYFLRTHQQGLFHLIRLGESVFLNAVFWTYSCRYSSLSVLSFTQMRYTISVVATATHISPLSLCGWPLSLDLPLKTRFQTRTRGISAFLPPHCRLAARRLAKDSHPWFELIARARTRRVVMTTSAAAGGGGGSTWETGRASGTAGRTAENCCHGGCSVGFHLCPSAATSRRCPELGGARGFCRRVGRDWGGHRRSLQDRRACGCSRGEAPGLDLRGPSASRRRRARRLP